MKDEKKVAIVTGATRGIGCAIAQQLLKDGFAIIASGTRPKSAYGETIKWMNDINYHIKYVQADISLSNDRKRIVEEAVRDYGRINLLVNNAGVAPTVRNDILEMTEESWDRVLSTNCKGNMFMTQVVANEMIRERNLKLIDHACIINISSCSAVVSSPSRAEYCISKAGISMLTKIYADRLASESINVYEVRPGVIMTDMTAKVHEKYNTLIKQGVFPIARWGRPEDVALAVSAFASGKFPYTTGNYIDVDGGFHIQRL
jgi:NAD(P)-dependent dehydrogenase (short-subunit alcohol dehydrogenase family)